MRTKKKSRSVSGTLEDELHYETMTVVADLLRKRQITSVELTRLTLNRIESVDDRLKSFATVTAENALRQPLTFLYGLILRHARSFWTMPFR